jgi:hypothetical protein
MTRFAVLARLTSALAPARPLLIRRRAQLLPALVGLPLLAAALLTDVPGLTLAAAGSMLATRLAVEAHARR